MHGGCKPLAEEQCRERTFQENVNCVLTCRVAQSQFRPTDDLFGEQRDQPVIRSGEYGNSLVCEIQFARALCSVPNP